MPASARSSSSSTDTYLVATTTVTDTPTSDLMRSYRSRSSSGDTGEHSLDAARLPVPPVREEELRMARGAEIEPVHLGDPGILECPFGRAPEVETAALDD